MLHIALHFIVPAVIAVLFFRKNWKVAYVLMVATIVVDIDHLIADPIYDSNRCSIGFHLLHELWFIILYIALCFMPITKYVGIGLTVHMALDAIDCQITNGVWMN